MCNPSENASRSRRRPLGRGKWWDPAVGEVDGVWNRKGRVFRLCFRGGAARASLSADWSHVCLGRPTCFQMISVRSPWSLVRMARRATSSKGDRKRCPRSRVRCCLQKSAGTICGWPCLSGANCKGLWLCQDSGVAPVARHKRWWGSAGCTVVEGIDHAEASFG